MTPAHSQSTFKSQVKRYTAEALTLLDQPDRAADRAMPGNAFFLDNHEVVALPRNNGDSRYPYGQDGFNFWVYASGYMHSNEGLFSHFLRAAEGQEPNIGFFAGLPTVQGNDEPRPTKFNKLSLMPVPRLDEAGLTGLRRFTILSSTAAYFITLVDRLSFAVRVFVTSENEVCYSLLVENLASDAGRLFVSSYFNPFLRNQIFETGEDRWFKEVRCHEPGPDQGSLGSFSIKVNEDKSRTESISHYGVIRRGLTIDPSGELTRQQQTASRYQYVGGARGSLHAAAALDEGRFGGHQPVCTFTETSIAGDLFHLELGPGGTARADWVFHYTRDSERFRELIPSPIDPAQIDGQLDALIRSDTQRHERMVLSLGNMNNVGTVPMKPEVFNAFIEHVKRQVEFCALIKGYVQLSPNSLIGIRDVFQAIEALIYWRPDAARAKMIEALGFTDVTGRCYRQYALPTSTGVTGRMDLRPFIDQGVWVISTVATYLRVTGDWAFLDEPCGYHQIVDEAARLVEPVDQRDSVLEHLLKIMGYLLDHRDHDQTGCVRAMYGDWNDALDGLGVSQDPNQDYGSGVSVMATLQVYQNCFELLELLEHLDPQDERYSDRKRALREAATEIAAGLKKYAIVSAPNGDERRLLHGWGDKRLYLVGGYDDPDGQARNGLTSNAFWVLSGLYSRDIDNRGAVDAETILTAFDRLDSKYGYKTFDPAFPENVRGVGRIGKLPPGTAENGAAYVHATVFAVMALFQLGQPRRAWEQMVKILPFTDLHQNLSHSPFVMPNSYGYNPEKFIDGQNMNDWQTGSSNVMLKLLIRFVFGFEPTLEGLWIQPAAWAPFKSSQLSIRYLGRVVKMVFRDEGKGQRRFFVNGAPHEGTPDQLLGITKLWLSKAEVEKIANSGEIEIQVTQ